MMFWGALSWGQKRNSADDVVGSVEEWSEKSGSIEKFIGRMEEGAERKFCHTRKRRKRRRKRRRRDYTGMKKQIVEHPIMVTYLTKHLTKDRSKRWTDSRIRLLSPSSVCLSV